MTIKLLYAILVDMDNLNNQNTDPSITANSGELKKSWEIDNKASIVDLLLSPQVEYVSLGGGEKTQDKKNTKRSGAKINLSDMRSPMSVAIGRNKDIEQELWSVIALGDHVSLGVIKAKKIEHRQHKKTTNKKQDDIYYLALMMSSHPRAVDRAKLVAVLQEGVSTTIGRADIEQARGEGWSAPGVSRAHMTIEIDQGELTVIDERSTNGTTVLVNRSNDRIRQLDSIEAWSIPSAEAKKLIDRGNNEAGRLIVEFSVDDN